jgi:hypothetical protein
VWSVSHVDAPEIVTSAWIDEQLAETYERLGVRPGLLESVAGIKARRWWPEDVTFDDAAARAGALALEQAGVAPGEVDLLISVIGKYFVGKILFSNKKLHGVKTHIQELLHMQEFEFESCIGD